MDNAQGCLFSHHQRSILSISALVIILKYIVDGIPLVNGSILVIVLHHVSWYPGYPTCPMHFCPSFFVSSWSVFVPLFKMAPCIVAFILHFVSSFNSELIWKRKKAMEEFYRGPLEHKVGVNLLSYHVPHILRIHLVSKIHLFWIWRFLINCFHRHTNHTLKK